MIVETLIVCVTLYAIFGGYFSARAEMIRQEAREKEIQTDKLEYDHHDEAGS